MKIFCTINLTPYRKQILLTYLQQTNFLTIFLSLAGAADEKRKKFRADIKSWDLDTAVRRSPADHE